MKCFTGWLFETMLHLFLSRMCSFPLSDLSQPSRCFIYMTTNKLHRLLYIVHMMISDYDYDINIIFYLFDTAKTG